MISNAVIIVNGRIKTIDSLKEKKQKDTKDINSQSKSVQKRRLTQDDINYLIKKHEYCLKILEDK